MGLDQPAEAGIRRTLARYCHRCDDGDFDAFAELFRADARFVVLGQEHVGPDAIKAFMEQAQPPEARGKHFLGQSDIAVDGERADVVTDYTFIAKRDGGYAITSAGRYHDTLVRDDDGEWRFAARRIVFL
jgi:uncharacterized protein (TIGR02246 family)